MEAKVIKLSHLLILLYGASGVTDRVSVFVMDGDSVTLNTGVKTNQQEQNLWYFKAIRIAKINGDFICTDVQCNEGNERFRDRLKLDHQTGSLTITNTRNTDSGEYKLLIISSNDNMNSEKIFNVSVHGVSASEREEVKRKTVKEGESVTLDSGVIKNTNDVMMWYSNDILITEITGDQTKICTDVQCKERFGDRLKLDHQTGSLTITDTRNTDTGEYQLQINNSSFSIRRRRSSNSVTIVKSFMVSVIAVPDSGPSAGAIAGIVVAVVVIAVLMIIAGVIIKGIRKQHSDQGPVAPAGLKKVG